MLVECVINLSEGRDQAALGHLAATVAPLLLDTHQDPHHHRAVFTLAGPADDVAEGARALATAAVARLDLRTHQGVHPRLGVFDVVPFVPYQPGRMPPADLSAVIPLRDDFAHWLADALGVPSFLYGPLPGGQTRTLPEIRRRAFVDLPPDFGPPRPDERAGASAVGAREVLVAYNLWVTSPEVAKRVAPLIRGPELRALGLAVGGRAQVSCNLVAPAVCGPEHVFDQVSTLAEEAGGAVEGAELVGLLPRSVLHAITPGRWPELGLAEAATVEARLDR